MKKLYAFAAAALATVSMNAQLYVCGAGDGLAWEPATPYVVELTDGAYTFEVNNLTQFKISTSMGSWEDFNANCLVCAYTEENIGKPVELVSGDANIGTPWKGDWTVVVAGDLSTLTMTTTTPKPEGPVEIFVRGDMNSWGTGDEWKFETTDDKSFTLHCTIEMGMEFKIADGDWNKYNWGPAGTEVYPDTEDLWNYNAGNATMAEDFTGTISFTIGEKYDDPIIVSFTSDAGVASITVDENAPVEYFNLQGVRVAQPESGLYIVRQGSKVTKRLVK